VHVAFFGDIRTVQVSGFRLECPELPQKERSYKAFTRQATHQTSAQSIFKEGNGIGTENDARGWLADHPVASLTAKTMPKLAPPSGFPLRGLLKSLTQDG
jgi:hypothetical protein